MRTLTLTLTNGVLTVEHTFKFDGSPGTPTLEMVEDAIDEMNHKLSVCEQALKQPVEAPA